MHLNSKGTLKISAYGPCSHFDLVAASGFAIQFMTVTMTKISTYVIKHIILVLDTLDLENLDYISVEKFILKY